MATGQDLLTAWRAAADVATTRAHETASLSPQLGRARPLAERSVGTPDAGATSMALVLHAVAGVLAEACPNQEKAASAR